MMSAMLANILSVAAVVVYFVALVQLFTGFRRVRRRAFGIAALAACLYMAALVSAAFGISAFGPSVLAAMKSLMTEEVSLAVLFGAALVFVAAVFLSRHRLGPEHVA